MYRYVSTGDEEEVDEESEEDEEASDVEEDEEADEPENGVKGELHPITPNRINAHPPIATNCLRQSNSSLTPPRRPAPRQKAQDGRRARRGSCAQWQGC